MKVHAHVETARKNELIPGLAAIHQGVVKFRLMGLHMLDELDKRIVNDFDQLADKIEEEINRLSKPVEEEKPDQSE
jgi:hypothetical protein